jgi:hypothetical protein
VGELEPGGVSDYRSLNEIDCYSCIHHHPQYFGTNLPMTDSPGYFV